MHISGTQVLAFRSNADEAFSRRKRSILRSDGVALVWITAACTLFAVMEAVTTMKLDPDLLQMMMG
jgi:hypothetical protein